MDGRGCCGWAPGTAPRGAHTAEGGTNGRALRRDHHRDGGRRRNARAYPGRLGQADPAAGPRRLPAPGATELGSPPGVRGRAVHLQGHLVRRRRQAVPAAGALLRRRGHQALRRGPVPAAPRGLRRTPARRRDLPGLAAVLRRLRALVHQGRAAVSGARQRRRGPHRGAPVRPLSLARGLPRAPDPAHLRRPGQGRVPPVPRALRDPARRGRPAPQHLHPVHLVRRVPVPGPRQVRRRYHRGPPGARPGQRHPGHRRRGDQAGDGRLRADGHRGRGLPERRPRGLHGGHRGRLRRRREQRQDPAQLRQRRSPERAGQRLRPGRPQLHVPQLPGRGGPVQGEERHRLPEDAGHQRLLLRHRGLRVPGRQHPDDRQVQRRGDARRKAEADQVRPRMVPVGRRGARRGLLADHRGPAGVLEPGDGRRRRPSPPGLPADQQLRGRPALPRAEEDHEPHRHGRAPRPGQELLHGHEHPARGLRPPGRHLSVRRGPGHLRARHQLQGPRSGQPVRRGHQLLPEHRRGEPRADRDGQRDQGRRAHPRSASRPEPVRGRWRPGARRTPFTRPG